MSQRFRVVVADFLKEDSVERSILGDIADIELADTTSESELLKHVPGADAIILFHEIKRLTDAVWSIADRCRMVVRAGVGYDNIDLEATGNRGIAACNVPDYGTEEVADHAIMMLLAVARRMVIADRAIRDGVWDPLIVSGSPRLRGRTLGLVGCGRIGSATAVRAKAFGLDVVFYDPHIPRGVEKALGVRRVNSLKDLMNQSDFVSLHTYLDEGSRYLIDAESLAWMKPGSILINTARGPVVHQESLIQALESGHLMGAGIDVFEREPLDDDRLRKLPNVILTPHSAFYSVEGYREMRSKAAEEVHRALLKQPLWNVVNRHFLKSPRVPV